MRGPMVQKKKKFDISGLVVTLAIFFLAFLIGVVFGTMKIPPGPTVRNALKGAAALKDYFLMSSGSVFETTVWTPIRPELKPGRGVTVNKPGQAFPGLTLATSGHEPSAFLLDMKGRVVHRWAPAWDQVWDPAWRHNSPPSKEKVTIRTAHLYPNGDILLLYIGYSITPWGLALVKADATGRVLWSLGRRVHHDIDLAPDGKIYTLGHGIVTESPKYAKFLTPPYLDDSILVISPEGRVLKEVSVLKALARSEYREVLVNHAMPWDGDLFHTNTIQLITPDQAAGLGIAEPGQVLVCLRNFNALALIDPEKEVVAWLQVGPWRWPHDPDLDDHGRLTIFDNLFRPGRASRVIQSDLISGDRTWVYSGTKERPLYSGLRSSQQVLPNGNVLICESDQGRLVEVDRSGAIVWEYVNPQRATHEGREYVAHLNVGRRFSAEDLEFLK